MRDRLTVYVATGYDHRARVHEFMSRLRERVPNAELAYNWTAHTLDDDPREVARAELDAIEECDLFVALLPGGAGTMTEIGYAAGQRVPGGVFIVGAEREQGWWPAPVFELCEVVSTEAVAIEMIAKVAGVDE